MSNISFDLIEKFLEGHNPQKYIVAIEGSYDNYVDLIINDPETGKYIERCKYKPFLWFKEDITSVLYDGKKSLIKENMLKFGIKIKGLKISNDDGYVPERLNNGYKFLAETKNSYTSLINFFISGGVDIWSEEFKSSFLVLTPQEQYLIQSGKRLFKGFDDYNDLNRLQFDLETEGLDPKTDGIFQIGIRNNKGFELILETKGETPKEKRESEKNNIIKFFEIIDILQPDLITGYNSENFDWLFFDYRCERLSLDLKGVAKTLSDKHKIKRREAKLKLGSEVIPYLQTYMWGYNILDISHAVRRAQAINSDIKKWGLKYITKFSKVGKKDRVYVDGDLIHKTWSDDSDYWFNNENGEWGLLHGSEYTNGLPESFKLVKGEYIVKRYLLDDLWETEQVDYIYNQASFLLAKILPTTYIKSSTMGTAGQWKLIMCAWSYENDLGIPNTQPKRDFTGGLSRLLKTGFSKNVVKFDFAALYPKTELTWNIFPDLDITGVMAGLLTYVVDKRDEFKFLAGEHKEKVKELKDKLKKYFNKLTQDRIDKANELISKESKLESDYDKKQLPLKILANSWFGSYGAPNIFPWGDTDCAEETTCRGRQSLRLMVKFFKDNYGFIPLVLDTDGCNFEIPENINDIKYTCKSSHWKTKKYQEGTILTGLDAVLAEFNETYMEGRMGLDIDDIYESTINFKRKNYANKIDGKIKLVGNSIKSKAMPTYIEEFINEGIELLLNDKGYEFIELYNKTINDIYNYRIPIIKIASKSKVKLTLNEYKNYCLQKNKNGNNKSRQAHMELALKHNLKVDNGDIIYYVNTGKSKSNSDIKAVKNKETGGVDIEFNCELISNEQINGNPNLINENYNVSKYIEAINKRISPLLVCFKKEIRDKILLNVVRDKKTKILILSEANAFTHQQCKLISGQPIDDSDEDDYVIDLMNMSDSEIKFWMSVDKIPNFMTEDEWLDVKFDYIERLITQKKEGIKTELKVIEDILKTTELKEYDNIKFNGILPKKILEIVNLNDDGFFESKKWGENLFDINFILKYYDEAKERDLWYTETKNRSEKDRYKLWVEYNDNKMYNTI